MILARIIARAYIADCERDDAAEDSPREEVRKDEDVHRATRDSHDGEGSH